MNQQRTVTAMVLASSSLGEYDKRLVLLTKELGRITVFARGVRKPGNQFMAACQPCTFGTFEVWEGKDSYRLVSAEITEYFLKLKEDFDGILYATYFCELVSYFTRENNPDPEMLKLLYVAMKALEKKQMPCSLIRYIYEIRILACNGEAIQVFSCVLCGKEEPLTGFSVDKGGLLCPGCLKHNERTIPIADTTRYTLQFIMATPITKLFSFVVTDTVLEEISEIAHRSMSQFTDRQFKSLEIIDSLT